MNPILKKFFKIGFFLFYIIYYKCSAQSNTLLWKVKNNTNNHCSYVYGTFHLGLKPDSSTLLYLDSLIKTSDKFYGELNFDSISASNVMKYAFLDKDNQLEGLFSKNDYEWMRQYFKDSFDLTLDNFKKYKPIFILTLLSTKDLMKNNKIGNSDFSIDRELFNQAKSKQVNCFGLETSEQQSKILFESTPLKIQAELLLNFLKSNKHDNDEIDEMIYYYSSGNLDSLYLLSVKSEITFDLKIFIDKRNENWIQTLENDFLNYNSFVAVGALHLPGPKGLLELLKSKKFIIEPMNIKLN